MKILHLLQSDRFSGAENVVCQIIGMFGNAPDYEFVYCSRDGQIREALAERGIAFAPLKELSVSEVKRVIKEQRPDVIHAHDMRASFVAAIACGKIRLVSHIHNSDFQARKVSLKSVLYLCSALKCSMIFWVSDSCFETYVFHKILSSKSRSLYNVIDRESVCEKVQRDSCNYNYDIVYVGRLAEPKNPQRLVRIVELVKRSVPGVKVGVVGAGELEQETKALASDLGVDGNITFLGFMGNPLKVLSSAKVMAMTSDREGVPMCALEAMALGVPIVSTPTDGLCDIVKPGYTGYLSNDDADFADKVIKLITDESAQAEFSRNTLDEFSRMNDLERYKKNLKKAYQI